jgi:heme/copper-type cytochrome/quinol oxidase subunit 2
LAARVAAAASSMAWTVVAYAAVFGGTSVQDGITQAAGLGGISPETSVVSIILKIINAILLIVLIIAVLVIIVAGIYLITSNGDEGQKDKAKKIIWYCIIGIVVILCSRLIVSFVNQLFD